MSLSSFPRRARSSDARSRAATVLVRVETDSAYAAPAIAAALSHPPVLPVVDRGLLTELVYGVLRTFRALDARLQRHASRPGSIAALDPYTRSVLRIGAYQILALGRIPPRAAVHAAVGALKRDRSPGTAGFANVLLRKLTAERPDPLPEGARVALALESTPQWVIEALSTVLGSKDEVRAMLGAAYARTPVTGIRVNTARVVRDDLHARLVAELGDTSIEPGAVSPLALRVAGGGDLLRTRVYAEGLFSVQEEGAQCVALAAGARPGMAVLDACAGRGGKTTALAAAMEGRGLLHATDLYPDKVNRIGEELDRLGLRGEQLAFEAAAADLITGLGDLSLRTPRDGYDLVVVDAPCSGLGTLAHRPDILTRERPAASNAEGAGPGSASIPPTQATQRPHSMPLPALQRAILARVAPLVRPGGVLVYAVCTLTRDEGPDAVDALRTMHPEFIPAEGETIVPERLRAAITVLRPDRDGTDGFMVFRLRRAQ